MDVLQRFVVALLVLLFNCNLLIDAKATVDLKMINYHYTSWHLQSGSVCHWGLFKDSWCSPYFRFCIVEKSGCISKLTGFGPYYEVPDTLFSFGTTLRGGVANPVIISLEEWPSDAKFSMGIYQNSASSSNTIAQLEGSFKQNTMNIVPGQNGTTPDYSAMVMHNQDNTLRFELHYRVTCDVDYYGPNCNKLCKATDNDSGHYTCSGNGDKICLTGWTNPALDCKERITGCSSSPCQNGATCVPREGYAFMCECPFEFIGLTCQNTNPCYPNPCQNEGNCNIDQNATQTVQTTTSLDFYCQCRPSYFGETCEVDGMTTKEAVTESTSAPHDPCFPNPCENEGTCELDTASNDYQCNCTAQFEGMNCEFKNPCYIEPCLNGGMCVVNGNATHEDKDNIETLDFICDCPPEYKGNNCELLALVTTEMSTSPLLRSTQTTLSLLSTSRSSFRTTETIGWKTSTHESGFSTERLTSEIFTPTQTPPQTPKVSSTPTSTPTPPQTPKVSSTPTSTHTPPQTPKVSSTSVSTPTPPQTPKVSSTSASTPTPPPTPTPTVFIPEGPVVLDKILTKDEIEVTEKLLRKLFHDKYGNNNRNVVQFIMSTQYAQGDNGDSVTVVWLRVFVNHRELGGNDVMSTVFEQGVDWLNKKLPGPVYLGQLKGFSTPSKSKGNSNFIFIIIGVVLVMALISLVGVFLVRSHLRKKRFANARVVGDPGISFTPGGEGYRLEEGRGSTYEYANPIYGSDAPQDTTQIDLTSGDAGVHHQSTALHDGPSESFA